MNQKSFHFATFVVALKTGKKFVKYFLCFKRNQLVCFSKTGHSYPVQCLLQLY